MKIYIDTEQVIQGVEKRPQLWDKLHYLYKSRDARTLAWTEIASEIVEDFDSFDRKDKQIIVNKIHQRWRTARDTYKKDKSGTGSTKKQRKYAYYDMLTFLEQTTNPAVDDTHEGDPLSEGTDGEQSIDDSEGRIAQVSVPYCERMMTAEFYNKPNQLVLEDEDLAFFQSLQPTLKKFNNLKKLQFRAKVLNVLMEIEQQNNDNEACSAGEYGNVIKLEVDH